MSFEKKIPSDDTLKNGLKDIADAIYDAEAVVRKEDVNTGTFDPTSDDPAGQKSTMDAIIEAVVRKEDVNTGTFDPTSDDPAGQKSTMDAIIEADLNARFSRASTLNLEGAFSNLSSVYSGKLHLLREPDFAWRESFDMTEIFGRARLFEIDNSDNLDQIFEHSKSIVFDKAFFACSALQKISATYSLRAVTSMRRAFEACTNLKMIKLRDYPVSFDISASTKFEEADLVEILNNLMDLTGKTAQTLTMGAENLAKLTDAEKAIATNKNWVLA